MKKLFIAGALTWFIAQPFFAKENVKEVKSDVKEVTIFLSGAQVTSAAAVTVAAGTTNLVFTDLSPYMWDYNIQARGEGDFTILSVVRKLNYLTAEDTPKEIKLLQDSLENLNDKYDYWESLKKIYEQQEQLLNANKSIGGQNTGVNIAELEKATNLYITKMTEIQNKKLEIKSKQKKISEQIAKINKQLTDWNNTKKSSTSEVTVSVSAKAPVSGKIFLTYIVPQAGWTPYYDIRAIDNSSPIKLEYRANVWQNSGYDWNDVKLTLSTANPSQSGTKPNLATWWINYYTPSYTNTSTYGGYKDGNAPPSTSMDLEQVNSEEDVKPKQKTNTSTTTANFTVMNDNSTNVSFEITIPYTVPSDAKKYVVSVQEMSLPAQYKYYCAPKLDKDAFLLAKITGWDKYNLISGEANIFYEGTYVGKSYLNTKTTNDTLDISLGRDKNIVVTRTKLVEQCDKKTIGLTKKETIVYEVSVRNKKKTEIEIDIDDQVPVSQNKDIEVELLESSSAKYDAVTGKLSWNFKLKPGETQKVKLGFSIKYPKDKVLTGL
ncbi:MAG: DUF4139 domain-containing protein [Bacteroidota bacterium]